MIVKELFKVKPGENFVITADSRSDERVVNATARAIYAAGAKPMVIWTLRRRGRESRWMTSCHPGRSRQP